MINNNLQLIELVVNGVAGGNQLRRIQFTNQYYLNGTIAQSIETFNINDVAKSPSGNDVVSADVIANSFITLYYKDEIKGDGEYVQLTPLVTMHILQNSENDAFERTPFILQDRVIIWDKCFITLGAPIGNTTNVSFLFNIGFKFNPAYTAN